MKKTWTLDIALIIALVSALIGLSPARAEAQVSFGDLKPAMTAQESVRDREVRRDRILKTYLNVPLSAPPKPPTLGFDPFARTMISRLIYKTDLAAVSANLLREDFVPWNPGTNIAISSWACQRVGDYDFVLQALIAMAMIDDEAGQTLLTPEARDKLRHVLLSQRGVKHHEKFGLEKCPFVTVTDSENHILMTEVARYLTNQLDSQDPGATEVSDNARNGFDDWMLLHLSNFLRNDFDEVNSRPYQAFTLIALANLTSYAKSPRVQLSARMVLDYLAAKTAIQSSGLRRSMPFRRQKPYRNANSLMDGDSAMSFFAADVGNFKFLELMQPNATSLTFEGNDYVLFMAAADRYEVSPTVLNLFFDRTEPIFERIKHRDVEIYAASKSFLISAGGRFRSVFGWGTDQNNAWAVSTTVIPANFGLLQSELFRFDGATAWENKNNLCVAPGFACGENPYIPSNIPLSCTVSRGDWTFFDLTNCPAAPMGFYVAMLKSGLKPSLGMLEVREPTIAFADFVQRVLASNADLSLSSSPSAYRTSDGREIIFSPLVKKHGDSQILSVDGVATATSTDAWPFLDGNAMSSRGDGLIEIGRAGSADGHLTIDVREPLRPKRVEN